NFSQTLGSGARFAHDAILIALSVLTAMLIITGTLISAALLRRIRAADVQYRQFLATARDAIFISNKRTGAVVEMNPAAEDMTGLPSNQLEGKRLADLLGSSTEFTDGEHAERVLRAADGRELRVDVRSSIARVHDTEVLVSIVRDVTEQRRLQERSAE